MFGTHNDTDIVEQILTKGRFVESKDIGKGPGGKDTCVASLVCTLTLD